MKELSPTDASNYAAPAVPKLDIIIESPGYTVPEELGCSWIPEFVPVSEGVCTEEGSFLQSLQSAGYRCHPTDCAGDCAGDSAAECVTPTDTGPDLSREGHFDARDAIHEQGQSPLVLDSMAGCQYRMTSSDTGCQYRMTLRRP